MTPDEIILAARSQYNAIGDTFFSDAELYTVIGSLCSEIISDGLVIEGKYATYSVADQQEYDYPTNAINIRRVTFDGKKLTHISMEEADKKYTQTAGVYGTGTPRDYATWGRVVYLFPVPADVKTIQIFTHDVQQTISATATIAIPNIFHSILVDGVIAEMAGKDKNFAMYDRYRGRFDTQRVLRVRDYRRAKRGDDPAMTKVIDTDGNTML